MTDLLAMRRISNAAPPAICAIETIHLTGMRGATPSKSTRAIIIPVEP